MRRISVLLLLITSVTFYAKSQEDTLRIKQKQSGSPFLLDSLRQHRRGNIPMKELFNESILYDDILNLRTKNRTYSFPPVKKKSSFPVFNAPYFKFIVPAAMISYGLIAQESDKLKELDKSTTHEIKEHYSGTFPIDDYMQYISYAAYYSLDICGIKAKHNFRDRTIVLVTSYAVMGGTVQCMKSVFGTKRPDGSSNTSFPSGHTATAFLGAHLLFREYKDVSPWIGIAGYLSATGVGCLRISNKKHWVSDVVTGAGIGILSAEVGYMLLPVFHNILGMKDRNKSLAIAPIISTESYGVGLAYAF